MCINCFKYVFNEGMVHIDSMFQDTIDVPKVVPTTESPEKVTDEHGWLAYIMDRPTAAPEEDKPCEMVVSLTHSGYKDFAVGIPKGSQLR